MNLQSIIAGDPASFRQFVQDLCIMSAIAGIFLICMARKAIGKALLWVGGLILYVAYPTVLTSFLIWNRIVALWNGLIDYMVEAEKAKGSLTLEERMYLDQTNMWI